MSTRPRYDNLAYMRMRAAQQQRRRHDATEGPYVIGRFVCIEHTYTLECVALNRATWTVTEEPLTKDWRQFHRWRTRQAAHQWINAPSRQDAGTLIVVNLAWLADGGKRRGIDD